MRRREALGDIPNTLEGITLQHHLFVKMLSTAQQRVYKLLVAKVSNHEEMPYVMYLKKLFARIDPQMRKTQEGIGWNNLMKQIIGTPAKAIAYSMILCD